MDSEDRDLRYGIVGVGMMGREHMLNLANLPRARVVAVADPHPPSRQTALDVAASVNPASSSRLQVFDSHSALLDSGLCDIIVVASPNMTHCQILLDILKHPKAHHILVEKPLCTTVADCKKVPFVNILVGKPLCTTVADCKQVVAAANSRREVVVQVGLEYRYMPPIARLLKHVRAGFLGNVRMVSIREHRFPFLVKVHNWNRFNANSGGTLVEKCCHFFDLMNLIIDARPVRIMASGAQNVNHFDEVYDGKVPDIIDNAYAIVEYDNGARAMLDLCMFAEGSENEQEISVVGDNGKGEALIPENILRIGRRVDGKAGVKTYECHDDRIKYEGLHHGSSYLEHLGFAAAVKSHGKCQPLVGLEAGLLSVALGVAAQLSMEAGRFVNMSEVLGN